MIAKEVVLFDDVPKDDAEIIHRIGDSGAVLLSYTSRIEKNVLDACPRHSLHWHVLQPIFRSKCQCRYSRRPCQKYYSIRRSRLRRVEYIISELIRYLHGFGDKQWQELPVELTDLKVGIVGLGTSGQLIAAGLQALGADL
jgi:hypothetical protein